MRGYYRLPLPALRAKSFSEVITLNFGPQARGPFRTEQVSTALCSPPSFCSACALGAAWPPQTHYVPLRAELPVGAGGGGHSSSVRWSAAQPGPAPLDPPLEAKPRPSLRPASAQGLHGLALLRGNAALVSSGEESIVLASQYAPFFPGSHWTLPSLNAPRIRSQSSAVTGVLPSVI